ncbi:MAG: hypothetical protein NZ580_07175, partial [Bacteroidia bacterium]|nr:hypothetical protein [Bacteroidia bacterium]
MSYKGVLYTWHPPSSFTPFSSSEEIPEPIQAALQRRGITPSQIHQYFSPNIANLPSPFSLPDIDSGLNLLQKALKHKYLIYVTSDYDVDGITSATLWYLFLKAHQHESFHIHIPDRHTE